MTSDPGIHRTAQMSDVDVAPHRQPWRRPVVAWLIIGVGVGAFLQTIQAMAMGGSPAGLLFLGTWQPLHAVVVEYLPQAPIFPGFGHDGQIFYSIALDPTGSWLPDSVQMEPYRYRRILYPALAGLFGNLTGESLLWGMIILASLPIGLAAAATAYLVRDPEIGLTSSVAVRWAPLLIVLNPGVWLSAQLLTADNLALGLGMIALATFLLRRDGLTVVALAGAALAKETGAAFAIGLVVVALTRREFRRAFRLALFSGMPVVAWWLYVATNISNPLDPAGALAFPFVGITQSVSYWWDQSIKDWYYLLLALGGVGAGTWVLITGRTFWGSLVAPWILLAIVSSLAIWHVGNNAARAFSTLLVLGVLGLGSRERTRGNRRELSPASMTEPSTD